MVKALVLVVGSFVFHEVDIVPGDSLNVLKDEIRAAAGLSGRTALDIYGAPAEGEDWVHGVRDNLAELGRGDPAAMDRFTNRTTTLRNSQALATRVREHFSGMVQLLAVKVHQPVAPRPASADYNLHDESDSRGSVKMKNLVFVAFAFAFVLLVIATLVATCYPRWAGQNLAYGALAVAVAIALISGTWFAHHLGIPRSAYIMVVYVACTCLPLIAGWWNETAEKETAEKKTAGGSAQAIPHGGKEDKIAERFAQAVPQVLKALIDAAKELQLME